MDSLDAVNDLCQEFGIAEARLDCRAAWDEELEWECARILSRHKGTRGQYQLAVENAYSHMQGWLRDGHVVPGIIADHFMGGVEMSPADLAKALADWIGTTRRAPVWCSLWWVKKKLEERRGEGRNGHQESQTNSSATGGDLGRKHGQ